MNERLTIQDLTDLLAAKHSMTKKDAEKAVAAVLETVQTVPGDAFSDNSQAAVVEITPEG